MDTLITKEYPVSETEFKELVRKKLLSEFITFSERITALRAELQNVKSEGFVSLKNGKHYLHVNERLFLPDCTGTEDLLKKENSFFDGLKCELPTVKQARKLVNIFKSCDVEPIVMCICDDERYSRLLNCDVPYNWVVERVIDDIENWPASVATIPVIKLEYHGWAELLVKYLIPFELCPDGLSEEGIKTFFRMAELFKLDNEAFKLTSQGDIVYGGVRALIDSYFENPGNDVFIRLRWDLIDMLKLYYEKRSVEVPDMDTKEELLNCEKVRADIEPYEERLLTDPNRGHWDLWREQDDSGYTIEVADNMVARNPMCDINENGVIAIDFGTKSTIVVYQSDIEHSLPMGIGDGNLSKGPSAKRFENPTVMHFVDLESFLAAYEGRAGRPKTKWEDLTISHTAMDQFSNSKSEEYYEYMHQIKQWAGQREKQFRVQSHKGGTYVLPAFLDVAEDEWNPIEIYAYYIGLYINNMRKGHGIFLDYYLSFPVTYETKIREKIIRSFEKGLKKSLPSSVVNNQELMGRFHVNGEISEPAAYAVCALQEYGFDPEDDEEFFYGIFDFGGGTTDFDFGLWKKSAKRRYDYTIESFGAGGDQYLGGENLLEMLAFEVFKENQAMMREKGFTFTLAPKCTEFLGSDSLLADSQEAEKNMHNLMEKIRPYWELQEREKKQTDESGVSDEVGEVITKMKIKLASHPEGEAIRETMNEILTTYIDESAEDLLGYLKNLAEKWDIDIFSEEDEVLDFVVTLFDRVGKDHPNEKLQFSKQRLDELIESRIAEGVNNFFSALMLSFQEARVKEAKNRNINILLAGNSCKSPVVRKVFGEVIAKHEQQIREKNHLTGSDEKFFELFPPLGTEDAYKKMESRGITVYRDDFEKPTGKTGVAFGLVQCRAGGTIERIVKESDHNEIPFQYFLGWRSKKKFVPFRDETKITRYMGKPDYNVWYKFIEADDSVFDLYYTTLPECVGGELMVDGNAGVKRLRCEVDVVDESASVYIRAIDPHTLEYVVAKGDDVDGSMLGKIVRKEL